jgi:hypothetical protein
VNKHDNAIHIRNLPKENYCDLEQFVVPFKVKPECGSGIVLRSASEKITNRV